MKYNLSLPTFFWKIIASFKKPAFLTFIFVRFLVSWKYKIKGKKHANTYRVIIQYYLNRILVMCSTRIQKVANLWFYSFLCVCGCCSFFLFLCCNKCLHAGVTFRYLTGERIWERDVCIDCWNIDKNKWKQKTAKAQIKITALINNWASNYIGFYRIAF